MVWYELLNLIENLYYRTKDDYMVKFDDKNTED